ncbi:MAG: alpha-E domain-containing protein [Rhodospirillaceae bacterium]
MLSRTADNLFWLSRYVERADYLARVLEATARLAALPAAYGAQGNEWAGALITAGCYDSFMKVHGTPSAENVIQYLAFSDQNPSSIRQCLEVARFNARAVRTALTVEMWETINGAWLELQRMDRSILSPARFARFTEWVKDISLRFDGSGYRTMLRNDAYWFSRLGIFLERADNTARILDVKYHILLPESVSVGGGLDYSQWAAILRSVNALTAYHWVYRESLRPWLIADLLILNRELPRSLASCYREIVDGLDNLAAAYGRQGRAQRLSRALHTSLESGSIEKVFHTGLHEFLTHFVADNHRIGAAISEQYLI